MSQFTIKRLGHQGDGIADGPQGDIYVPYTLPGEVIEGDLTGDRIETPRIVTPSAQRVKAPCGHFKTCGGCALQHASDTFLADWKIEVVRKAFDAQGLRAEFRPIATSPAQSRRRATFTGRRTKKGAMVGFHSRGSEALVAIPGCTLLHPDIMAGLPALEALCRLGASRTTSILVSVTQSAYGLDVDMQGARPADGPMLAQLGILTEQLRLARLCWNGDVVATRTAPAQVFGPAKVTPPPGGFLQATEAGQAALTDAVTQAVGPARHIVDLFSGCGTFTLPLAQKAEVLAVESDALALAALDAGWRMAQGLKTVNTAVRDLFRRPLEPVELNKFDAVVIDPPRAGAKAQFEALAASSVARIAAVSCNPVTFARDAAILVAAGYQIDWIQVIDQFRWSPHVELVAAFSRS